VWDASEYIASAKCIAIAGIIATAVSIMTRDVSIIARVVSIIASTVSIIASIVSFLAIGNLLPSACCYIESTTEECLHERTSSCKRDPVGDSTVAGLTLRNQQQTPWGVLRVGGKSAS
jgi:hypothetical protein